MKRKSTYVLILISLATAINLKAQEIVSLRVDTAACLGDTVDVSIGFMPWRNVVLHNGTVEQKFDANGVRTTYTTVRAFEFTGDSRQFDMSWSMDSDSELEAGIYRVSLFANGNLIGVTEFKLK